RNVDVAHAISHDHMPQHFANNVIGREQVTSERQFAVAPRVFNKLTNCIFARLLSQTTPNAINSPVHALVTREPPQKLDDKRAKLSRRVTFSQHRSRDGMLQTAPLQTQLTKHAVKLVELVRLKLQNLVLGHERRQPANLPRH